MNSILFIYLIGFLIPVFGNHLQNAVLGPPIVDCMDEKVMFRFQTKNIFNGRLYIKGRFGDDKCRKNFFINEDPGGNFSIPLGVCGMQRLKTAKPAGIFFTVPIVLSFHPMFLTDGDKAFNIRCFYQAESRLITAMMGVSNIATTEVSSDAPMPDCKYSVRAGNIDGPEVRFSKIGDKVFHVWQCDPIGNYKVLIHNCFVSDTGGKTKIAIIDERGCSIDPIVIGDVTYSPHRAMGVAESFVFKYADESMIYFTCTARICTQEDQICTNAPKSCPLTAEGQRGKRLTNEVEMFSNDRLSDAFEDQMVNNRFESARLMRSRRNDMDVASKNILVDDVGENLTPHADDFNLNKKSPICLSAGWFSAFVTVLCGFGMALVMIAVYKCFSYTQRWDESNFGAVIGVHPDAVGMPAITFGSADLPNMIKSANYRNEA